MFFTNEAEILIEKLKEYFKTETISELAEQLNVSQPTLSAWRKRNSIAAIRAKCRELGIYQEIFEDENVIEEIKAINQSQASFNNASTGVDMSSGSKTIHTASTYPQIDKLDEYTRNLLFTILAKFKDNEKELQNKFLKVLADG